MATTRGSDKVQQSKRRSDIIEKIMGHTHTTTTTSGYSAYKIPKAVPCNKRVLFLSKALIRLQVLNCIKYIAKTLSY